LEHENVGINVEVLFLVDASNIYRTLHNDKSVNVGLMTYFFQFFQSVKIYVNVHTIHMRFIFLSESILLWSHIAHIFEAKQNWSKFYHSLTKGFLEFELSSGNQDRYWNTPGNTSLSFVNGMVTLNMILV